MKKCIGFEQTFEGSNIKCNSECLHVEMWLVVIFVVLVPYISTQL